LNDHKTNLIFSSKRLLKIQKPTKLDEAE